MRNCYVFGLLMLLSVQAFGAVKVAPELQKLTSSDNVDVIVQFSQAPTTVQHQVVASFGGTLKNVLSSANAGLYSLPGSSIAGLAASNQVVYVSANRTNYAMVDYAAQAVSANIAAQYKYNGQSIGVAVIDSGVSAVADFDSRIVYNESFVPGDATTNDLFGHGTHVSGILAGSGASSTGSTFTHTFTGIAPGANILNLRVLDANGMGTDSSIIAAIDRAIALQQQYNIRVINLSVGRPVYESFSVDPLCQAMERAWASGMVVVVAAGNFGRNSFIGNKGYGTITSPGNDPTVITVGAMKTESTSSVSDDQIATYSSKGPTLLDHIVKPDIVAPGNQMVSAKAPGSTLAGLASTAVPYSYYSVNGSNDASNDYMRLSGTSMATPVVSGAVAILLQQNPNLSPDQIKAKLMKTARKEFSRVSVTTDPTVGQTFITQSDIFTVGAGYLDIGAALQNSDLGSGVALSPLAVRGGDGNIYLADSAPSFAAATSGIPTGAQSLWGTGTSWVGSAVWGNSVLVPGQSAPWGGNAIWGGGSAAWGSPNSALDFVVWGNTSAAAQDFVVWGNSTPAALDFVVWGNNSPVAQDFVVWGNNSPTALDFVVWGNSTAAALDFVVWGNYSPAALDFVVWGNSSPTAALDFVVWGNSAVTSNSILTGGEK
jgi:serine protease AprX